ncbi:DgyrCDS14440 [Dimorphilus gyrociliatus]|uniref:DgyrCDS14440 n=1 Tax=Dimorphilus gyrociliatus TaxID=2664684 RepID=A0A7I8WDM4_9ANNE|nr:DgyrCDS14440 [Dimorphilus gyrociliatus]
MNSREKLSFNYYRKDIETLFMKECELLEMCASQYDLNSWASGETFIVELANPKKKTKAVQELLNYLSEISIDETLKILETINDNGNKQAEQLKEKLKDQTYVWHKLVAATKEQRRDDCGLIFLLPFIGTKQARIEYINTPIKMLQITSENIIERKLVDTEVTYENFFKIFYEKSYNKILIEGKPGGGKSVHMKNLLFKWSKIEDKDKLFIFLILKNVQMEKSLYEEIVEQNFKNIPFINANIVELFFTEKRNDVILLLDGADEFHLKNHKINSILNARKTNIPTAIWSRNWKAQMFESTCDIAFELMGWDTIQMENFFSKCFISKEKSANFIEKVINNNSNIKRLCKIPILAMILFHLWNEKKDISKKSLYEIYEDLVKIILEKNRKILKESDQNRLCELSFMNLAKNKIILPKDSNEQEVFKEGLQCLIQVIPTESDKIELHFYHLSFQEFFSAQFLIKQFRQSNRNTFLSSMDNLFKETNNSTIYNVIDFIKEYCEDIFNDIILYSELVRKMYNCSDNIKKILCQDWDDSDTMNLENDDIHDYILETLIKKIGKFIKIVKIVNTNINTKLLFEMLFSNADGLKKLIIHHTVFSDYSSNNIFLSKYLWNLEQLEIRDCYLNEQTLEYVEKVIGYCPSLKIFILSDNKMLGDGFNAVCERLASQKITHIDVSNCHLNNQEIITLGKTIAQCSGLENIDLSYNKQIGEIFEVISDGLKTPLKHLKQIKLVECGLTEKQAVSLHKIIQGCSCLEIIDLSGNQNAELGRNFGRDSFKSLIKVYLKYCCVREKEAILLESCSFLQCLDLSENKLMGNGFKNICNGISSSCGFIKEINLKSCNLTEKQGEWLGDALKNCSLLESVSLSYNRLGEKALETICDGLMSSSSKLSEINLTSCFLSKKSANSLSKIIQGCTALESIDLSENEELGREFVKIFQNCSEKLKTLKLSNCKVNQVDAHSLQKLTQICSSLEIVDLSHNKEMGNGFQSICWQWSKGNSLKEINLSYCNLSKTEGEVLGKALEKCHSLTTLDLSGNKKIGKAFYEIFKQLQFCKKLKDINISACQIAIDTAFYFRTAIEGHTSIETINVSSNHNIDMIFQTLMSSSSALKKINIANCNLNNLEAVLFNTLLKHCRAIREINLNDLYRIYKDL